MHSLQLHTGTLGIPIMLKALSGRSANSFADTLTVTSSSGESCMLAELCMCTDYSSSPTAIPLLNGQMLVLSGVNFSSDSGALRCHRCKRKRPYRFTSLSTA